DAHPAQPGDALRPLPLDRGAPHEVEAELGEEIDRGIQVLDHDADVVHPLDAHGIHGVGGNLPVRRSLQSGGPRAADAMTAVNAVPARVLLDSLGDGPYPSPNLNRRG